MGRGDGVSNFRSVGRKVSRYGMGGNICAAIEESGHSLVGQWRNRSTGKRLAPIFFEAGKILPCSQAVPSSSLDSVMQMRHVCS